MTSYEWEYKFVVFILIYPSLISPMSTYWREYKFVVFI